MAVSTLVSTAGSATANSYTSVAVADQYHSDRPAVGTTWASATTDQKTAALLWSTKLLESYFEWVGYPTYDTQALLWPRIGLVDLNGQPLDETTVPDRIQWATAEYARQLLVSDRAGDSAIETMGIKLIKMGSMRIDFDGDVYAKPVPDVVCRLIPSNWGYVRSRYILELERA